MAFVFEALELESSWSVAAEFEDELSADSSEDEELELELSSALALEELDESELELSLVSSNVEDAPSASSLVELVAEESSDSDADSLFDSSEDDELESFALSELDPHELFESLADCSEPIELESDCSLCELSAR